MCTIADAKVRQNYNCYNVYFNECLPLDRINGFLVRIEDAYCTKERKCNWKNTK
jgi:hypothetical protein